jgi:predicted nuclease with RNAse H fold
VASHIVVGVDVGGIKKGFHAVALRNGQFYGKMATGDAADVASWCRSLDAMAVGVDAPCCWSLNGGARPCERELARAGFTTFATPNLLVGECHPFYGWMVNGANLYRQLAPRFPRYTRRSSGTRSVCFETFPHAVACILAKQTLAAKNKLKDRPRLLRQVGVLLYTSVGIDTVDAALCAVAAHYFAMGQFQTYGEATEGFIIVPDHKTPSKLIPCRASTRDQQTVRC